MAIAGRLPDGQVRRIEKGVIMAELCRFTITASGSLSKTLDVIGSKTIDFTTRVEKIYTSGSAYGEADLFVPIAVTVGAQGDMNVDLYGALTTIYGDTANYASIKGLYIYSKSDNAGSLPAGLTGNLLEAIYGESVSIDIYPGDVITHASSAAIATVTATSQDVITVTNNDLSEDVTIEFLIVGVSA